MTSGSDRSDFEAPTLDELQPLFPSYRIEGFIAQGGMGAVYLGYQTNLDRPVAIKILPREFGADALFRESFAAEARAMARLNHPNLIGVYDFGDIDGMLFIVMEYVDGISLHDWSIGTPLEPAKAVELVTAISRGIAHAHELGVLHRDIKPANILLDSKLRPKIGDFGLARPLGEQASADEVIYGTPGYAAPELTHRGTVDQRADVFSLGALLYRLLTGAEPASHPLPPVSAVCGAPLILDILIARATALDPNQRFAGANEFADNLNQGSRIVAARPAPSVRPAIPVAPPQAPVSRPAARAGGRKPVGGLVWAGIAATVVIGTVVVVKNRDGGGKQKPARGPEVVLSAVPATNDNAASDKSISADSTQPEREPIPQALARLKAKLAAGARDEFPEGTAAREESHFLVLNVEMGWQEAERFAEDHGAHLAVLPTEDDRSWLRETFHFAQPLWVGASAGARDQWAWLDATPWSADGKVTGASSHDHSIAFSPAGSLFPADSGKAYGLALQWRADGSNPATLDAQLARLRDTAAGTAPDSDQIVFPPGTRSFEDSHYLHLRKVMRWDEARQFAESLGAYLAVPGSEAEQAWLASVYAPALAEGETLWLGGYRLKPGDRWQWLSHEGWNNSGWQGNQPESDPNLNRLALRSALGAEPPGWVAGNGELGVASGLLLEWSAAREPVAVASFQKESWLEGVRPKIAGRVSSDLEEFEKLKKGLVQEYLRAMGRIVRKEEDEPDWGGRGRGGNGARDPRNFRFPGANRRILEEIEEGLKESAKSGQLLAELPFGASEAFREQHKKSQADLALLEETFDLKIQDQLRFYVDGVRKKAADLAQSGYLDDARELNALAASLDGDLPAFLKLLFPDSPRATLPWKTRGKEEARDEQPDRGPGPGAFPAPRARPRPGPADPDSDPADLDPEMNQE